MSQYLTPIANYIVENLTGEYRIPTVQVILIPLHTSTRQFDWMEFVTIIEENIIAYISELLEDDKEVDEWIFDSKFAITTYSKQGIFTIVFNRYDLPNGDERETIAEKVYEQGILSRKAVKKIQEWVANQYINA